MATFRGTPGNDTITPLAISAGVIVDPVGSDLSGDDYLVGDLGGDVLDGGAGDDTILASRETYGGAEDGADQLIGGDGNDTLVYVGTGDSADGGAGDDLVQLHGSGQALTLHGGEGSDTLDNGGTGWWADPGDLSGVDITGFEVLTASAILTTEQFQQFLQVGTTTPGVASGYGFKFVDAAHPVDFTGKTEGNDYYHVEGSAADDHVTLDPLTRLETAGWFNAIYGRAGNDTLIGTDSKDGLYGDEGDDALTGLGGHDYLVGGLGGDILDGGAGDDTLFATVEAYPGTADGADTLIGGDGNDTLQAISSGDSAYGGAGDDLFQLRNEGQAALLDGGAGRDTLDNTNVSWSLAEVPISGMEVLTEGATLTTTQMNAFSQVATSTEGFSRWYGYNFVDAVEAVDFTDKTDGLDTFVIEGSAGDDRITLDPSITHDGSTMHGRAGDDSLTGTNGRDGLYGDEGDDTLTGLGGNDYLLADAGVDLLDAGAGDDTNDGGGGYDTYRFERGWGHDVAYDIDAFGKLLFPGYDPSELTFTDQNGDLFVNDTEGNTLLFVGYHTGNYDYDIEIISPNQPPVAVDDSATTEYATVAPIAVLANDSDLNGNLDPASVTLAAGPTHGTAWALDDGTIAYLPASGFLGTDSFTYTVADLAGAVSSEATVSVTVAYAATSILEGTAGADVINGTPDPDIIYGFAGNDQLVGNSGDDLLIGGDGEDKLLGNNGTDTLDGGAGADELFGNSDGDRFVIAHTDAIDIIQGFNPRQGDEIFLSIADILTGRAGNELIAGTVRAIDAGNDLLLQVDVGDGFETVADIANGAGLSLDDILANPIA